MGYVFDCRGLTVKFGKKVALDHLDLALESHGNIIGLFGQNGSGKSTLMRVMCGLIGRYSGTVVMGRDAVGYLPDSPFLYGFLTAEQCIETAQELFDDFDADITRTILNELDLPSAIKVSEMSKGMSEQLHLSIILGRRCLLYVFDEPLAAVDPFTRDKLIAMIGKYRLESSTAVISTHLINGLEELFDEAVVIHDGRLVLHEGLEDTSNLEKRVKEVIGSHVVAG